MFTQIPNQLIQDERISDRARFVFCYMASKPDDWEFLMIPLAKSLGYGRKTLGKYLKELEGFGWVEIGAQQNINGRWGAKEIVLNAQACLSAEEDTVGKKPPAVKGVTQKERNAKSGQQTKTKLEQTLDDKKERKEVKEKIDLFERVEGMKKRIGKTQYAMINQACEEEEVYLKLRGMFRDGRFESLISWLEYKKDIKKIYKSKISIKKIVVEFSDYTPLEVSTALNVSLKNSYVGIFFKVLNDNKVRDIRQGVKKGGVNGIMASKLRGKQKAI